jgi:hypothetical protein
VNPHLFRHCAATTIAIVQPGQVGVARDLLGHASINTTNAYYNRARSIEASRLHASIVAEHRADTGALPQREPFNRDHDARGNGRRPALSGKELVDNETNDVSG